MEKTPIIEVKNFTAAYGDLVVLDNISFDIYLGEIFMVIGGSGCGKTTLLQHMIGLLAPKSGDILIEGESINSASESDRLAILRKMGVLYQSNALFGSLSLLDNVSLPLEELTDLPRDAIVEIARDKLKMVGLDGFFDYMPSEISGGMQKRAALARAMVLDPQVLFLDEPTSGLDPISSSEIDQLVVNLSSILGTTFVIVTHDVASICKIATRVVLLHKKKIEAKGVPKELLKSQNHFVEKFFKSRMLHD